MDGRADAGDDLMGMLWLPAPRRASGPTGPCGSGYTPGAAAAFNGASSVLARATEAALDATGALLIAAWVYPTAKAALYTIAGKCDTSSLSLHEWELGYFNGNDSFFFSRTDTGDNNAGAFHTNGGATALNTWQFVAGWFNGSNQIGCSKNDGTPNVNAVAGTTASNRSPFRIGASADGTRFWPGRMARVAYLKPSAANIAARVTSLYNGGVPKSYADLTAGELADTTGFWELAEIDGVPTYCDWHTNELHLTATDMAQAAGP